MFNSSKSIETAAELLSQYKINPEQIRNQIGDSKLWTAQTLVRASTNADTQEIIPLPFRLCGFVTFNMPILIGLCLPNAGLPMMMGMQWANTTHNGAINFYNRNASNPTDPVLLGSSYVAACAGGMGIAYVLKKFIENRPWTAVKKAKLGAYISFPAVCVANSMNMVCMRFKELMEGIPVTDKITGAELGSSKKAAQKAIAETTISRLVITAGVLFVPPLIMGQLEPILEKATKCPKQLANKKLFALCGVCAICFYGILPVSVAAFPQYRDMKTSELEPEIAKLAISDTVVFNRGQ